MQIVIPAAGKGTRLRPYTYAVPKSLIPLAGKTLLDHLLDRTRTLPVLKYILIVGYLGEKISEHIQTNYHHLSTAIVRQEEQKGLGHSIWTARKAINTAEPLLIILGDTIADVEWEKLLDAPHSLLGVHEVNTPEHFGIAVVNAEGKITKLIEKPENPPSRLAIVGIYYIRFPELLLDCLHEIITNDIRTRGEYQLTDALQLMIDRGETFLPLEVQHWYDCGNLESWLLTNRMLLHHHPSIYPDTMENVQIYPPVIIDQTARITDSSIGPYVSIGKNATISHSQISNCVIGDNVNIENVILNQSAIGDYSSISNFSGQIHICAYTTIRGNKGD